MEDQFHDVKRLRECSTAEERQRLLAELFTVHRQRLRFVVQLRLDPRLQAVVDPSDALQEAFIVASKRIEEYLRAPSLPLFLWLRSLAGQKLHELHSFHFGVQKRDARKNLHLGGGMPGASSVALASRLADSAKSPGELAVQNERRTRIQASIDGMDPKDREILGLRFYESLTGPEAAQVIGIPEEAARKRYFRALKRLKGLIGELGTE